MAANFYYRHLTKDYGPIGSTELRELAASGDVLPDGEVRKGETGSWVRADKVQGLFEIVKPQRAHPISCSECGSDNCQRVEILFHSGTSVTRATALMLASAQSGVADAVSFMSGTVQSSLAAQLAPPVRREVGVGRLVALIAIACAATAVLGAVAGVPEAIGFAALLFICFGGAVRILAIPRLKEAARFNTEEWPTLFDRWQRKFICLKCGHVWERLA